jgi:hypothetical protein
VCAQLPGKDFKALYDTGASISIVKTSAWQKMKHRPPLLSGSVSATSASGNRMTIRGHVVVPLRIFNSVKLTKLFVCDEICSEMLLVVDIIQSFKLIYDPELSEVTPRQRWIEKIEADFANRAQAAVQSVDSERNGSKSKHFSKGRIAKLHNWLETQADGTNLAKTDHAVMKNDDDTPFEDPTLSSKNCKFHVKTVKHCQQYHC